MWLPLELMDTPCMIFQPTPDDLETAQSSFEGPHQGTKSCNAKPHFQFDPRHNCRTNNPSPNLSAGAIIAQMLFSQHHNASEVQRQSTVGQRLGHCSSMIPCSKRHGFAGMQGSSKILQWHSKG